jgi:hypothetical protein
LTLFLSIAGSGTVEANDDDDGLIHYAFATFLGTGVYHTSGRTVQIYQLPMSYMLRDLENNNWGLLLRFPVTVGLFDFKFDDILDFDLPDELETITFVPGLEFQFPVTDDWLLMPYGDFGFGKDLSGGDLTYIYSAGIGSKFYFAWKDKDFTLGNNLRYAGYRSSDGNGGDYYVSFETGLDMRFPSGFSVGGWETNFSLYAINFIYLKDLEFFRVVRNFFDPVEVYLQYEVGLTFGTKRIAKVWLFKIPRVGIGYRFGDNLSIVRLVLGMPF